MESISVVSPQTLANLVRCKNNKVLVIDSRTFCEFNTSHILNSVNVWSSKIRKRKLQQESISVHECLRQACQRSVPLEGLDIIVYDQTAQAAPVVPQDSFLHVLLTKLGAAYPSVYLLAGGFLVFQANFPELCEDSTKKCTPLTTFSQPCLPVSNLGPTKILSFLYLGSQHDANNRQFLQDHNILYELNVSVTCPKPDFLQESQFMRIPVNDSFNEKLLPFFHDAFRFIDKVRESGGSALVHCLAGISRSPTVAIAYVMKHLKLHYEDAYSYVKSRRPTISPNINFVGQLLELDKQFRREGLFRDAISDIVATPGLFKSSGRKCGATSVISVMNENSTSSSSDRLNGQHSLELNLKTTLQAASCHSSDMSPTSSLSKLTFSSVSKDENSSPPPYVSSRLPSSPITSLPSTPVPFPYEDERFTHVFHRFPSTTSSLSSLRSTCSKQNKLNCVYSGAYEVSSRPVGCISPHRKLSSVREVTCSSESDQVVTSKESGSSFFSCASICLTADAESSWSNLCEGRKRSLCVLEVSHEPSSIDYIQSCSTEPMIVRETEVYAMPCSAKGKENVDFEQNADCDLPDDTKVVSGQLREFEVPIKVSENDPLICGKEGRPRSLGLSASSFVIADKMHSSADTSSSAKLWLPGSPKEASTAEQMGPIPPEEASPPLESSKSESSERNLPHTGLFQSDSGVAVNEEDQKQLHRCYSSGETHLNTRRLLEQRGLSLPDYVTRKSLSTDEVGRGWTHHPPPQAHTHPSPQIVTCKDISLWSYPSELARCDSWSTSGLGSEISDWDSLQEEPHCNQNEDPVGPFDAVFSEVFPGDQDVQMETPQVNVPLLARTPRPASLPGVTGTSTSNFGDSAEQSLDFVDVDIELEGVELRKEKCRGRIGARNDSGYYSCDSSALRGAGEASSYNTSDSDGDAGSVVAGCHALSGASTALGENRRPSTSPASPFAFLPTSSRKSGSAQGDAAPCGSPPSPLVFRRPERGRAGDPRDLKARSTSAKQEPRGAGDPFRFSEDRRHSFEAHPAELKDEVAGERRRSRDVLDGGRWSCDVPPSLPEGVSGKWSSSSSCPPVPVDAGAQLADLFESMETAISSEFYGLRSCTSAISDKLRPGVPAPPGESPSSAVESWKSKARSLQQDPESGAASCRTQFQKSRSEPPFRDEEGLYRARSCPGISQQLAAAQRDKEGSGAVVSRAPKVRLRDKARGSAAPALNRYSCGALDSGVHARHFPFDSCPDVRTGTPYKRNSDSLDSSKSSISPHSSYSLLLEVS